MSVIHDLLVGAAFLAPIGVGVGLVAAFGRDRTADEHDLSDYHQSQVPSAIPAPGRPWSELDVDEPGVVWHDSAAKARHDDRHDRDLAAQAAYQAAKPTLGRGIRPAAALTAPVGLAAWETAVRADGPVPPLARALMIEWAVPTLSDAAVRGIADDMLREIAAEQQARAGIRPAVDHWAVLDGSCYDDCPACARDLTGAFPVVAVA